MEIYKVYQNSELDIEQNHQDEYVTVEDAVKSVEVKIEAARSGKMNNNFVMYTPRAMEQGMLSFIYPFHKHLQSRHNGDAVGVIKEALHVPVDFENSSEDFKRIIRDFKEASERSDGKALAKAARELRASPEYQDPTYKGLGLAQIQGVIYDKDTIYSIRTKDPRKGQVSIGGKSKETYCSICGGKGNLKHMHKQGRTYAKELCFYIHNDLQLDHCGFVSIPADSNTHTQVVEDSLQEELTMNVVKYNKEDNSAEHKMNLAALKQKIKDQKAVEALITEYIPDEAKASRAKEIYTESLEDSRPNHYLFGTEGLLNIKTPVGIKIADKLLEELEEGPDKEFLKEALASETKLKNITSIDETLEESLKTPGKEVNLNPDETLEEPKEENVPGGSEVTNSPLKSELTEEAINSLSERLANLIDQKIKEREETTRVEDSLKTEYTKQELNTLRNTLDADQTALKDISKKYRQSLVDQIVLLKSGDVTDEYLEKLSSRSADQLQTTIEDLRETTKQPSKRVPEKNNTEEAFTKVEDQVRDLEAPKGKEATTTEEPKDSEETSETQTETEKETEMKVEDGLTPEQAFYADCKLMGLPAAYKKHKNNLLKK